MARANIMMDYQDHDKLETLRWSFFFVTSLV